MILTEKQLYKSLKKKYPYADWQRIEAVNVPDVNVATKIDEYWFELKIARIHSPRKGDKTFSTTLTAGQAAWLHKRFLSRHNTYVLVYFPKPYNICALIPGTIAPDFVRSKTELEPWLKFRGTSLDYLLRKT